MPDTHVISRRRLLWLPLALAAWPRRRARAADAAAGADAAADAAGSLDAFVAAAQPIARRLVADASRAGQDAYVYQLAALAVRLRQVPPRPLFPFAAAPGARLAPAYRGSPFFVIEWRLEPHARLPPHDHPSYSVCTVALDGEAEVEHYEPLPDARLRKTRESLLQPGSVDTLSAWRDNIHAFRAGPRGAHGLDITTLHGTDHGFHWIDLDGAATVGAVVSARLRAG
jgi:hypothetical protein